MKRWEDEKMGQDQATGFLTLCSLSATKHEIIFISISSVPLRGGGEHTISKSDPRGLFNEVKGIVIISQMAILFKSCTSGNRL